jgi:hypothetical protein
MKSKNISSGFRAAGLYLLATADSWLEAYGEQHNIEMSTTGLEFIQNRQNIVENHPPSNTVDALNLQLYRPTKRKLPLPSLHQPKKKKPRLSIIGENLSHAKILNLPARMKKLFGEQKKRREVHKQILKRKKEKEERREENKKVPSDV